jgi:recombination protein RecR
LRTAFAGAEIERLIQALAKLPGLGPRSARRAAIDLLTRKAVLLDPLLNALGEAAAKIRVCSSCGSIDTSDPCTLCADPKRESATLCVVEDVGDVWALERAGIFRGRYHVLGGTLSALDGRGPEALNIARLLDRVAHEAVAEVILALSATVEGQMTAHYLTEKLAGSGAAITRPAHGVPVGGELGALDDGTLAAAFKARKPLRH